MAKLSKELLNKRIKKKKTENIEQKEKRENIVCIMRMREKKRYVKFRNVHETYEKATDGVLFVSCCWPKWKSRCFCCFDWSLWTLSCVYLTNVSYCSVSLVDKSCSYCSRIDRSCSRKRRAHIWAVWVYVNIGVSSVVVDDDVKAVSEQGFLKTNDRFLFGDEVNIDCCCCCCCFDGDDGLVLMVNVVVDDDEDDIGDDGGDNFISARFLLTPCSTGSNSSERLSDATANIIVSGTRKLESMKRRTRS